MNSFKKSILLFLAIAISFEVIVAFVGDIKNREGWGDETRFHQTIIEFGDEITIDKLQHYRQMSTPFPFIAYSFWGRLFGFDLFTLRLLSILIALLTYSLFFRLLHESSRFKHIPILGVLFLMVHPYMVGLSIFVFTDMMAILFMLCAYWAFRKRYVWLFGISLALAILSRQYMLFLLPPFIIFALINLFGNKSREQLNLVLSALLSVLPFVGLIILWGGSSPDNDLRQMYLSDGLYFKLHVLFLYIALLFVYMFPYYLFVWRKFYTNKKVMILSLTISMLYFLFPIQPASYSVDIGVHTVGLFHKALVYLFSSDTVVQILFYLFVLLGLPVLLTIIKDLITSLKRKVIDVRLLNGLIVLFFFIVMPFSYLGWEKYFVPLLPILIILFSNEYEKQNE